MNSCMLCFLLLLSLSTALGSFSAFLSESDSFLYLNQIHFFTVLSTPLDCYSEHKGEKNDLVKFLMNAL